MPPKFLSVGRGGHGRGGIFGYPSALMSVRSSGGASLSVVPTGSQRAAVSLPPMSARAAPQTVSPPSSAAISKTAPRLVARVARDPSVYDMQDESRLMTFVVLDASSSMGGVRLEHAKTIIRHVAKSVAIDAIITFNSGEPRVFDVSGLDRVAIDGGSFITPAIEKLADLSCAAKTERQQTPEILRVLFFTDGDLHDIPVIGSALEDLHERLQLPVQTTAVSLGLDGKTEVFRKLGRSTATHVADTAPEEVLESAKTTVVECLSKSLGWFDPATRRLWVELPEASHSHLFAAAVDKVAAASSSSSSSSSSVSASSSMEAEDGSSQQCERETRGKEVVEYSLLCEGFSDNPGDEQDAVVQSIDHAEDVTLAQAFAAVFACYADSVSLSKYKQLDVDLKYYLPRAGMTDLQKELSAQSNSSVSHQIAIMALRRGHAAAVQSLSSITSSSSTSSIRSCSSTIRY